MFAGRLRLETWEISLLVLVLATAVGLRLWGVFFGLPHVYNEDEGFEVYRAMRLGTGSFDLDRWGKGGYYILLFAQYGVYFVFLLATGAVSGIWDFATHFVTDPSPFWKIGRVTTALMGAATVLFAWWQGKKMGGAWAGLFSAWFLAWSFLHVRDSHFITVDVPMALFTFWALIMLAEDAAGRRPLNPYLFPPVAAFAMACKFPAVLLAIPYVLACLMRGGLRGERGLLTRASLLPGIATVVLYLALNPGILLHLSGVMALVSGEFVETEAFAGTETPNLWAFYGEALLDSQGVALLLAAMAGLAVALVRERGAAVIHLSFMIVFFVSLAVAGSGRLYYDRYAIPLLPGLCVFAGLALAAAMERVRLRWAAGALACAAAALLVVEPGASAVRDNRELVRGDTRTRTLEWIEANVADGTRILLEGFPEADSTLSVPLTNTRANIERIVERLKETDPGKALFWELRLKSHGPPAYDLVTVRHFELWGTLAEYRSAGVRYAVLRQNRFVVGGPTAGRQQDTMESRYSFYRTLQDDEDAALVASFYPERDGLTGPPVEVWRLTP